jgi:DNA-binding FrmR family transcriptional regulator
LSLAIYSPLVYEGGMPHSPQEKKKAISRLRRIKGQAEALERAIEDGEECGKVLQQLAALRGAVNGMILEVLEGHMKETFAPEEGIESIPQKVLKNNLDEALTLIRSYLK